MACAILTIGTEITRGELCDTNAAWLSSRLVELGHEVHAHESCDDDDDRIVLRLRSLSERFAIVIVTGGLGPTTDDRTAKACAVALAVPLVRDEGSITAIRERFLKIGRTMSVSNEKQADFPAGAEVIQNPIGTAPGFSCAMGKARMFFTPGVPREMKRMFEHEIAPRIEPLATRNQAQVRLRTFGLPESVVGEKIADLEGAHSSDAGQVTLGYRAHFPEIEVKVLASAASREQASALASRVADDVRGRLGDIIYAEGEIPFPSFVAAELRKSNKTLAIAESCTGGLVGHLLTLEAGASSFLLLDAVVYHNDAKVKVLGLDGRALAAHGAVSEHTCRAMAERARLLVDADLALAITGIAGPSGGTEEKPVGTVFLGVATRAAVHVTRRAFGVERAQIQRLAAYAGLELIRRALREG